MFYDLESPITFAQDVYECLGNDGIWHLEQSYMPSMVKNVSYDTICHEHLEYYSLESIKFIFDYVGFKIIDLEFNLKNILATDINLDGILKGPNIEIYKKITDLSPSSNIIGSGGISCIDDVNRLSKINICECIVGKAIYEKKIDLMDLSNVN